MNPPEPHLPVTLRDVARTLGVSHVTVSLALRNNPQIPPARCVQIQAAALKMGYRPNAAAAALALHKRRRAAPPVEAALAWVNHWPQPRKLHRYIEFDHYWRGAYAAAEKFGYRLEEFVCGRQLTLPRLEAVLFARGIRGILLPPHPAGVGVGGVSLGPVFGHALWPFDPGPAPARRHQRPGGQRHAGLPGNARAGLRAGRPGHRPVGGPRRVAQGGVHDGPGIGGTRAASAPAHHRRRREFLRAPGAPAPAGCATPGPTRSSAT